MMEGTGILNGYVTPKEIAQILGLSHNCILTYIRRGILPAKRSVSGYYYIERPIAQKFIGEFLIQELEDDDED